MKIGQQNIMAACTGQKLIQDASTASADLMLLLRQVEGAEKVEEMIYSAKEKFVLQHHKRNITCISKGAKEGNYKTYFGNPRKAVEAVSYRAMILKLFDLYTGNALNSLHEAIEWELEYRKSIKGTTQETANTLRYCINRTLSKDLLKTGMKDLTDSMICNDIRIRIQERSLTYSDVKTTLQVLHGAFRQAITRRILQYDPLAGVQASAFAKDCSFYRKKKDPVQYNDDIFQDDYEVFSPEIIKIIQDHMWKLVESETSARAILLNTYLGLRIGEDPALMVSDIKDDVLHVHQSQIKHDHTDTAPQAFEIVPWTKNERGISKGGRYIPLDLDPAIRPLLEICKKYARNGYLFSDDNGIPVTKDSIRCFLERHMKMIEKESGIHFARSNNHVFRKSLNSNVLIPYGFDEIERSMMLGHSPRVNLENYTYKGSYKYAGIVEKVKTHSKSLSDNTRSLTGHSILGEYTGDKVIVFTSKEKASRPVKPRPEGTFLSLEAT
ncbi:MAG: site-specific integrase [Lachnospiraceae bacterium]|nr:site-specific integrase [Lachnospiraceae bacterium]